MPTTVTVKGQVTIPKAVRDRAGIRPGSRVEISNAVDGGVLVMPADPQHEIERRRVEIGARLDAAQAIWEAQRDPNDPWQNMTADEYMAELRDPLEPFEREALLR